MTIKTIWIPFLLVLLVLQSCSQMIRQQIFQGNGTSLPRGIYFDVYSSQTVSLVISTNCPNLHYIFTSSSGNILCNFCTMVNMNSGLTHSLNCNLPSGLRQQLYLQDYYDTPSCNWSYYFSLRFYCSVVTSNCFDCLNYTTCISCESGFFLYLNKCYPKISYCLVMNGISCVTCISGSILINGVCRLCTSFMPNCKTCINQNECTSCESTLYALDSLKQCKQCSHFITDCLVCSSNTTCNSCKSGFGLVNPSTCQACSLTLTNCLTCINSTYCANCVPVLYTRNSGGSCQLCGDFMPNCEFCTNMTFCYKCFDGYALNTTFHPNECIPCSTNDWYCILCDSSSNCIACEAGYFLDSGGSCQSCGTAISGCLQCSNSTHCTKCQDGKYIFTSGVAPFTECKPCMIKCLLCSNQNSCGKCITNHHFSLMTQKCESCEWFMYGCLQCLSGSYCTKCSTFSTFNHKNSCSHCSDFIKYCAQCTDNTTCIECVYGYLLEDGVCKNCGMYLANCTSCVTKTACLDCDKGFGRDSLSQCKPCSFLIANCSRCEDDITCLNCQPGYALMAGSCLLCSQIHPNCHTCIDSTSCRVCESGYYVNAGKCQKCKNFINHCDVCFNTTICERCFETYEVDSLKKCKCKSPLYNVSDLCTDDKHCLTAYKKNGVILCSFCNMGELFVANQSGRCVCKLGYEEVNDKCLQKCGDGIIIRAECDDNNTDNGDGCSSTCKIEPDYICQKLPSGVSFCRFKKDIKLKLFYIEKIPSHNKAIIYINLDSSDPNIINFFQSSRFKFNIISSQPNSISIVNTKKNAKNQIQIQIEYNQTVESSKMLLNFTFPNQTVISSYNLLKFELKGNNFPLITSAFNDKYEKVSQIYFYFFIVFYAFGFCMLFFDKFIGVEAINSLQVVFFSLLLIKNSNSWPEAFSTFLTFKLTTGLNHIVFKQINSQNMLNPSFNKFRYLGIHDYFILNNLVNFIILLISSTVFLVLYIIKYKKQSIIYHIDNPKKKKKLLKNLKIFSKIFKKAFNFTFNFSYILIFQVFISIYVQFSYLKNVSTWIKAANKGAVFISMTIIILTLLENYKRLFLASHDVASEKYAFGRQQLQYRRVYFFYIFFNVACILFLNDKLIMGMSISVLVLLVAILYFVYLLVYKPYKFSFKIHSVTILLSQFLFILILTVITFINFGFTLEQFYLLSLCYIVLVFTVLITIMSIVRVIFEYKYGQEKQNQFINQVKKEIENEEKNKIYVKSSEDKLPGNNDSTKQIDKIKENKYTFENQKQEADKIDLLNELKQKSFLNDWEKDQAYYRIYDKKPLHWVKQNENEEKYKYLLEKEKDRYERDLKKQELLKSKRQKQADKVYMEEMMGIKEKLKVQFLARKEKLQMKMLQKKRKKKEQNELFNLQS